MVVQHNLRAMNSNRMLNVTANEQSKSTEKLSSGYRINRAADDAAGLSISEKMRSQVRGLNQASRNSQDGISYLQTAEGALAEVSDMLQRVNELAVQASNGTSNATQDAYINNEVTQLTTEIARISDTTKFNGLTVFGGTDMTVQAGETNDAANTITIEAPEAMAFTYTLTSDTAANAVIASVAADIETIASQRSTLGGFQNRLEHTIKNLDNISENITAAESRIRDTDMSTEMVKYSNNNILAQAGQSMLAQSNQANQGILGLLQ